MQVLKINLLTKSKTKYGKESYNTGNVCWTTNKINYRRVNPPTNKIFLSFSEIGIIMRTFLVNFIHTSAGQSYNADFVLLTQETFPTSREIYKRIKSAAVERGLHVHGPILWTGITELTESDNQQFNREEE